MHLVNPRIVTILVAMLALAPSTAATQDWSAVWRDPEIVNYELTMEKVRKLVAVQRDMAALAKSEPEVPAKIDAEMKAMQKNRTAPGTVAEAAGLLDRHSSMRNIFSKHGMTAREWLAVTGAMSTAAVYLMLEKRQTPEASRASQLSAAQKANLALFKKNQAEWQKIQEEFKQLAAESASKANK